VVGMEINEMTGLIGQHEAFQQGYDACKKDMAELYDKAPSVSICRELNKCQTAFNELQAKYDKCMEFTKKVNGMMTDDYEEAIVWLCDLEDEAEKLLKELSEC